MGYCSWLVSCRLFWLFLDFVTKLQKCTTLAYSCSTSECTKREALCMAGGDELCENLNPSQDLHAKTRVCVLEEELKMEASLNVKE